jgi:two-component system, NarL family, invasion response regulator UvrY
VNDAGPRDRARRPRPEAGAVGVLVGDHHAVFRSALREVIATLPRFHLLAEASSGLEAVASAEAVAPDVVLLDVRLPDIGGIQAARRIKAQRPHAVVLLLSIDDVSAIPSAARECGAVALVRKQDFGPAVLRGLWALHGHVGAGAGPSGASAGTASCSGASGGRSPTSSA